LVCSFPLVAFCAEQHGYKGDIYCICTDTDIARAWVPRIPSKSRIIYLISTRRLGERLKLYGVKSDNIIVTGFPLPDMSNESLHRRLIKLDPKNVYRKKYEKLLSLYMDHEKLHEHQSEPLTITFAIGGAGAQSGIAMNILSSFRENIIAGQIRLNLAAGTSAMIRDRFENEIVFMKLNEYKDKGVSVIFSRDKYDYFDKFNKLLEKTDILWTKPSELSFYVALGLPIIMSPALGMQEESNRSWLHMMGAGFEQYDPRFAHEWVFDWINSGWLAEAAMNGYLNVSRHGTTNIEDVVLRKKRSEIEDVHFV
jgi:hypothetical protein